MTNATHFERKLPRRVIDEIGEVGGVWAGRYRIVDAVTLEVKREYSSRQTSRRIGDVWEERIEYMYTDAGSQEKVFHAKMGPNGAHVYGYDQEVSGRSEKTSQGQVLFPYIWSDADEDVEVLEVQHYITETRRTRVWQRFRHEKLYELVIIEEEKLSSQADPR